MLLVCYVFSCIDEGKTASQIIEEVHVWKAITWLQTSWKIVSTEIIKQCIKNLCFNIGDMLIINEVIDTDFQELFAQISGETAPDEYTDFDAETITPEPAVNTRRLATQILRKKHCIGLAIGRYCFNQ